MGQGNHLFRRMWGVESRRQNHKGDVACWDRDRFDGWKAQGAETYFSDLLRGTHCGSTNWYEGSSQNHGFFQAGDAPALLGYDNDIEQFCEWSCDQHNLNILNLFGGIQYNQCRNFEWQMCAAMGRLPGQRSPTIIFAKAPSELDISTPKRSGGRPLEKCGGYSPAGCWAGAYANDDIYFLETCLYSMVCANNDELFRVKEREPFHCRVSEAGLRRLQAYLTGSSG